MSLTTLSIDSGVARLTMDNPSAYNSLSEAMLAELQSQLETLGNAEAVRAVVIAAEGKAFCAGHDLKEMRSKPEAEYYRELFGRCGKLMLAIQKLPVPVIARVQGVATAAGCQMVAACDLAVASDNARFAVSGVNLGLFCSTPAVALSRNVPRKQALEMLITGDFISAAEAEKRGLINHCVPADKLDETITLLTKNICGKPRSAIAMGKKLFYEQIEMGTAAAYQLASNTMACNMMEADTLEGVQAFIDKRPPNWN